MARKLLKLALLVATVAIYGVLFAQSRIPVTGHFGGVGTDPANNFGVKFELAYCGANLPRVFGLFNPVLTNTTFVVDPTTGLITGQIWPNDVLNCGGVIGGTRYNVTAMVNNVPQGPPACYQVLSSVGTFNLDTAQPCVQVPPPPPPPGFGDYEFNNLQLTGTLLGVDAIFTGDVTALSFHFSTAGNHFTCPAGQFSNALKQDFTLNCAAPPTPTAPVTSVFGRTGAVAAAANDYNFNQLAGKLGIGQTDTTIVYPGTFNKAQIWDHTPTGCTAVAGQALASATPATNGNITCTRTAVPTSSAQGVIITTPCSGGGFSNCICTPGTASSFDECSVNIAAPVPFSTALDGASANCETQPINNGASNNGAASCNVIGGNPSGVTVMIQNLRGSAANVDWLSVTFVGH